MHRNPPRKSRQGQSWPRYEKFGGVTVPIYRRTTGSGSFGFMVADDSSGKRKFKSYSTEDEALDAASLLARQWSQLGVIGASITKEQSLEYASAVQILDKLQVSLPDAVSVIKQSVELVGDLPGVIAAARYYKTRNKTITPQYLPDVVLELIKIKKARNASARYVKDLQNRLTKFANSFRCNVANVETASIQAWLDGLKLSNQSYMNFRRVISLLFEFAIARSYVLENPVEAVEVVKVASGDIEIFTPFEIEKLLSEADDEFVPCLALGAFAGLRSAEIERLRWHDVDLIGRNIKILTGTAKTASRRIVPIAENLALWLAPYSARIGNVWAGTSIGFYKQMPLTAERAGLIWKQNGLRHSFISYRLALIQNAAQVALEAGNSPQTIFKHYRELVKPKDAFAWFGVNPKAPDNLVNLKVVQS